MIMWLIIGVALGLGLAYLISGIRAGRVSVRWYQWILGLIALVLLLLAVQNFFALQDELQPKMANFALVAFGVPGAILTVVAVGLPAVFGRKGATKATSTVKPA